MEALKGFSAYVIFPQIKNIGFLYTFRFRCVGFESH